MKLKNFIKKNQYLAYVFYTLKDLLFSKKIDLAKYEVDNYWHSRITDVLSCSDNNKIIKVYNAGQVEGNYQVMHNGLKIFIGSYYGYGNALAGMHQMLKLSKGVHEPQEEYAFQEILTRISAGSIMLELGAYWSFYSMWFNKSVKEAVNYMIEPDARCLYSGKRNFKLNGLKGNFFQYFISEKSGDGNVSVDDFLKTQKIEKLAILHADIQGYELKMLKGATESLREKRIDYLFISTHSNDLHIDCIALLESYGYKIVCDANLNQAYSYDGVIVASVDETLSIEVAKKISQ